MWSEEEIRELKEALEERFFDDDEFHPTEFIVLPSVINVLDGILKDECVGIGEDHTYNFQGTREIYRRNISKEKSEEV